MSLTHNLFRQIRANLTIAVRFADTTNFGVDYQLEEYYTLVNEVHIACEVIPT